MLKYLIIFILFSFPVNALQPGDYVLFKETLGCNKLEDLEKFIKHSKNFYKQGRSSRDYVNYNIRNFKKKCAFGNLNVELIEFLGATNFRFLKKNNEWSLKHVLKYKARFCFLQKRTKFGLIGKCKIVYIAIKDNK